MSRRALVVVNSVSYGDASKNVPRSVVASIARDVGARLKNMEEEFRYTVAIVKDEPRARAREQMRRAIKSAGESHESVLLFYFGHAFQPDDNEELYLFFKDSDPFDPPTMLKFGEIAEWLELYNVPGFVSVMDCCHAGMIAHHPQLLSRYGGRFFVMASVNATGKALVDYGDEQPIGLFTRHFLQAFGSVGARAQGREVTFSSFFHEIESRMARSSKQQPYSHDQGLGNELFFRQATSPVILPGINDEAPKKSIYRKLFAIGTTLLKKDFRSAGELHFFLERRGAPEFLQPVKRPDGAVGYRFVSLESFRAYVWLGREIAALEALDPVRLSSAGKKMVRNFGARYNVELLALVRAVWARQGVKLEDLEDAIAQRLKGTTAPTVNGIYRDVLLAKRLSISKQAFRILLDLTAYTGALGCSADKTYFPSTAQEPDED
ncbi:MAG: hypothetical protein ABSA70_15635 [Terriglobia bacterium]